MRGDTQCCYRRRMINIARQMQLLLGRIVMVTEKIIRLHDVNILDLRRLQNFSRALCARDVRACTHLAPPAKRATDPNLRPNSNNQWHPNVEQPVRPQSKAEWTADIQQPPRTEHKSD